MGSMAAAEVSEASIESARSCGGKQPLGAPHIHQRFSRVRTLYLVHAPRDAECSVPELVLAKSAHR